MHFKKANDRSRSKNIVKENVLKEAFVEGPGNFLSILLEKYLQASLGVSVSLRKIDSPCNAVSSHDHVFDYNCLRAPHSIISSVYVSSIIVVQYL